MPSHHAWPFETAFWAGDRGGNGSEGSNRSQRLPPDRGWGCPKGSCCSCCPSDDRGRLPPPGVPSLLIRSDGMGSCCCGTVRFHVCQGDVPDAVVGVAGGSRGVAATGDRLLLLLLAAGKRAAPIWWRPWGLEHELELGAPLLQGRVGAQGLPELPPELLRGLLLRGGGAGSLAGGGGRGEASREGQRGPRGWGWSRGGVEAPEPASEPPTEREQGSCADEGAITIGSRRSCW